MFFYPLRSLFRALARNAFRVISLASIEFNRELDFAITDSVTEGRN